VAERPGPADGRRGRAPLVSSPEAAHRAALDLLARRSHFENEIERKLEQKGFVPGDVCAALERLRAARLVDDLRCAVELLTSRLRRAPQGRRRLRAELARKGLAADVIAAALEAVLPGDEAALARDAAQRFRRRTRAADPRTLARHLDRLGFTTRDILAVSEEPPDLQPSDDDDGC
jgi:SOS response regulatory protein OraA/RecX